MIDTVRDTRIHSVKGATTTAEFMISRFKLQVIVQLTAPPGTHTVEFKLDPHCTAAGKRVLKEVRRISNFNALNFLRVILASACAAAAAAAAVAAAGIAVAAA
jgi:hypothetical protein